MEQKDLLNTVHIQFFMTYNVFYRTCKNIVIHEGIFSYSLQTTSKYSIFSCCLRAGTAPLESLEKICRDYMAGRFHAIRSPWGLYGL